MGESPLPALVQHVFTTTVTKSMSEALCPPGGSSNYGRSFLMNQTVREITVCLLVGVCVCVCAENTHLRHLFSVELCKKSASLRACVRACICVCACKVQVGSFVMIEGRS